MAAQNYTIKFVNNSPSAGSVWVLQQGRGGDGNIVPLAWFTRDCPAAADTLIEWTIEHSFIWGQTGTLLTGLTFYASQIAPAIAGNQNIFDFAQPNGTLQFGEPQQAPPPVSPFVIGDAAVPVTPTSSVGIGMSGSGTFVTKADPNLSTGFTPHPTHWVTEGNHEPGKVLDFTNMTNTGSRTAVDFPPDVYAVTVTLNPDNTFTVVPGM